MTDRLTRSEVKLVDTLILTYQKHRDQIDLFRNQLLIALASSADLSEAVHSIRSRLKDPEHLRDKLVRKLRQCNQEKRAFDIRPESLLIKVNDLGGVRILPLYTIQFRTIYPPIRHFFSTQ